MRRWLTAVLIGTALAADGPSLAAAATPTGAVQPLEYGVAWYPEQWSEASWDADLRLMRGGGFTFVRIAEFSWSTIQPAEGAYDWVWLDHAVAHARATGLKVVLGTPTAAPPAWMTEKYPEILLVEPDGRPGRHGGRRQFSVGSALYRQKAAQIAGLMAARYGRDPCVLGFQIDNEYGRATVDPETRARFQTWLHAKYGTLAAFNAAYVGAQWSLDYSSWGQVPIPDARDSPALYLDWMRFFSEEWRDYQQVQIDAIRPHLARNKFITTNFTGRYDNFDFALTAQRLDLVAWDWYFPGARVDPAEGGLLHDMNRGFLGKNPWVIETAAGNTSWADRNYTMPKGEVRAMAWQAVAHGADGYAFWTWRPARNGIEQFHGALTDVGGRPQPVYAEAAQIGSEFARTRAAFAGTDPVADVAMLHDFPSRWAVERQPMSIDFDPFSLFTDFYRATRPAVAGIAVPHDTADLSRYRLVVAPMLHVVSAATAAALDKYVRDGGHLVLGPRSGVKNPGNSLWQPGAPGPLAALIGAHVDQTHVPPAPLTLLGDLGPGAATIWAERLAIDAPDVATLLHYPASDDWLDRAPGVVTRRVGKGRVTYIGAWLDAASLRRVMAWAAADAGAAPLVAGLPEGVEATSRTRGAHRVTVLVNWAAADRTVDLPLAMHELLSGTTEKRILLKPYGVAVLGN